MLRREKLNQLMSSGVLILDPSNTYIDWHCRVGAGTVLHPQIQLEGSTRIAENCRIRSFSRITDCRLDAEVTVLEGSVLVDSSFGRGTSVGPSAHVRGGSSIGRAVRIGNYVEVKNCRIGDETKAAHLTYLGDATIGKDVNIGAGTITCNYDGVRKNPTWIGDNAFIGSDSQLIAPVRIGVGAYVAAGSTITKDVPADSLAIARERQSVKPGWAKQRRAAIDAEKKKLRGSSR
jgi:bifunctional UDP-N-acetylglucosamine pyrophosphorylase/glucosamine-1-phosphate N-acetyltransferase